MACERSSEDVADSTLALLNSRVLANNSLPYRCDRVGSGFTALQEWEEKDYAEDLAAQLFIPEVPASDTRLSRWPAERDDALYPSSQTRNGGSLCSHHSTFKRHIFDFRDGLSAEGPRRLLLRVPDRRLGNSPMICCMATMAMLLPTATPG
jgi:hypothetical protein